MAWKPQSCTRAALQLTLWWLAVPQPKHTTTTFVNPTQIYAFVLYLFLFLPYGRAKKETDHLLAINPGNSGGPALCGDACIGMVYQTLLGTSNIGYIIPVPVIACCFRDFFASVSRGLVEKCGSSMAAAKALPRTYAAHFPAIRCALQWMESEHLRDYYGLRDGDSGVLIVSILPRSPVRGTLFPDDVLLSVNGYRIGNDGTIAFRGQERIGFRTILQLSGSNSLHFKVWRNRSVVDVTCLETSERPLVPHHLTNGEFRERPKVFVFGGLVFSTLSYPLLMEWGQDWIVRAPRLFVNLYYGDAELDDEFLDVVTIVQVLPHEVNKGYPLAYGTVVTHLNNTKIVSFNQFVTAMRAIVNPDSPAAQGSATPPSPNHVVLGLKAQQPYKIVLPLHEARAADEELASAYGIPSNFLSSSSTTGG